MEELYTAKYNVYWYLSYIVPAVIMIFTFYWNKKWILVMGIIISLLATFFLRVAAVDEKWNIRNEIADTPEEKTYAEADGANLIFETAFIAPFQAIVSVICWSIICCVARTIMKNKQKVFCLTPL